MPLSRVIKVTKIDEPTISGRRGDGPLTCLWDGKAFTYTFNATKSSDPLGWR